MATRKSPQILIVEDEVLIRVFLSDVLEDVGFKTRQAATADEALELLQVGEFAAVVSDIEMPGKTTGLDLAWTIDRKWPRTGLVLVSGRQLPSPAGMPAKALRSFGRKRSGRYRSGNPPEVPRRASKKSPARAGLRLR
jgi:CheY-like chemotaxis protein